MIEMIFYERILSLEKAMAKAVRESRREGYKTINEVPTMRRERYALNLLTYLQNVEYYNFFSEKNHKIKFKALSEMINE
jgi:predicted phosphatase